MENVIKRELIEFLGLFNFPKKHKNSQPDLFDKTLHENDEIINVMNDFDKHISNSKAFNKENIQIKAEYFANKLNSTEKVKIILFFAGCYHNVLTNEIEAEYEEIIYLIGNSIGFKNEEIKEIIDFQLNEEPFNDKTNSIYLVNKNSKFSHKQICVNTISYNNEDTVYVKYLRKSNIFLAKSFITKNISHYLSEKIITDGVKVINCSNYNRNDFAYNSFEEMVELIENFNPVLLYELEATANTPKIILDPELGKVIISGKSSPLSPTNFFNPILEWINHYKLNSNKTLEVYLILDYFNTYTSKFLMRLAQESKIMNQKGKTTKLYWYCDNEDEDLVEFGEHLQSINNKGVEFCFINEELVA